MRKNKAIFLTLFSALALGRINSQKIDKSLVKEYQKVLILSSGGTMGLAWQLATLQKYEERKKINLNNFDLTIGTSAGSIAALLLGSDKHITELSKDLTHFASIMEDQLKNSPQKFFTRKNWKKPFYSFKGVKFPHFGLFFSSALSEGVNTLTYLENYLNHELKHTWPLRETWVIAADIENGKREIIHRGSGLTPGSAAIASSAVPALFSSISHGNKRYIDGGTISSSHLDIALRLKCKEVTLLTVSPGFTNPFTSRDAIVILNKINQNIEELNIIKSKIWGKITNTKIKIIRPTYLESKILTTNRLMDSSLLEHLVKETLKKS
jgi:predicted acylesterase/phospholipase RssA